MQKFTVKHTNGTTTVNQQSSLFESILSNGGKDSKDKRIPVNTDQKAKMLKNSTYVFYNKEDFNYADYKEALKFNYKNVQKLILEQLQAPPKRILSKLLKYDFSQLIEMKFKDINFKDSHFEYFQKDGIPKKFPSLKVFEVVGSSDLSSQFLSYCFINVKRPIFLTNLDLSYTKVDYLGLSHLSDFEWPSLNHLGLQWCTKITEIDPICHRASNFPQLNSIDLRFTPLNSIQVIFESDLIFQLKNIRLFGSTIKSPDFKLNYMMKIFVDVLKKKQTKEIYLIFGKFSTETEQKKILNPVQDTSEDFSQVNINFFVSIDSNMKINIQTRWFTTIYLAIIHLIEIPDPQCIEILMTYLQKDKEIKKTLKNINLKLEDIPLNEKLVLCIGDGIANLTELQTLTFSARNQDLREKNYFYLFDSLTYLINVTQLNLVLTNSNIVMTNNFLTQLLRAVSKLDFLYEFYLNLLQNKILITKDIREFIYQLVTYRKGLHFLNHYYLLFTHDKSLEYQFEEVLDLYLNCYSKNVCINFDTNLLPFTNSNQEFEKLFARKISDLRKTKKRLILQLKLLQLCDIKKKFRKGIIEETIEYFLI